MPRRKRPSAGARHVAIQVGDWTEKRDVSLKAEVSSVSVALSQVMSIEELEALRAKMIAAVAAKQLSAGPVVEVVAQVIEEPAKPEPGPEHEWMK